MKWTELSSPKKTRKLRRVSSEFSPQRTQSRSKQCKVKRSFKRIYIIDSLNTFWANFTLFSSPIKFWPIFTLSSRDKFRPNNFFGRTWFRLRRRKKNCFKDNVHWILMVCDTNCNELSSLDTKGYQKKKTFQVCLRKQFPTPSGF